MQPEDSNPHASSSTAAKQSRILVVDDHKEIVNLTCRILERQNYSVTTCMDGNSALEMARRDHPDLILLDIMLPEVNGLEVCRQLKSNVETRNQMILMITGRGSINNLVEGLEAGADDYLTKPFHVAELLARVKSALRIKNLNDEIESSHRELMRTQRECIQAEKMATIGLLATGIAHEFNNIMSGIAGFAQLAKKDDKFKDKLVEVSLIQAQRALQITSSLSSFYKSSGQSHEMEIIPEVENALCLITKKLKEKDIEIVKEFDDIPTVAAKPGQLQEVFLNLLLNACDAFEEEGKITIKTQHVGSNVEISIRDTGCGIPEKELARIFDPFFTTKGSLGGGNKSGSGLGLSVSYNIIHSYGGKLTVSSEVGAGTEFKVMLPASTGKMESKTDSDRKPGIVKASTPETLQGFQNQNILIADPNESLREMVGDFLKSYQISNCTSWQEVYDNLSHQSYDVIIIDVDLPGEEAFLENIDYTVKSHPDIPLIVTSQNLSSEISRGISSKTSLHLIKPYSMENLTNILNTATSKKNRH